MSLLKQEWILDYILERRKQFLTRLFGVWQVFSKAVAARFSLHNYTRLRIRL